MSAEAPMDDVEGCSGMRNSEEAYSDGSVESFELTRQTFEKHMRNIAFASWDDLRAAIAERPTVQGYVSLHGESETVMKLDPVRVFGLAAAIFLNVCFWGLFFHFSGVLGFVVTVVLGGPLWWSLTNGTMSPRLAGILWPNLPLVVGAAGLSLTSWLWSDSDPRNHDYWLPLLVCVLPQTFAAAWLLRGLPSDPDRASLLLNLYVGIGTAAAWTLSLALLPRETFLFWTTSAVVLVEGLLGIAIAVRFFFVPGVLGSVEFVSWNLNLGATAVVGAVFACDAVPVLLDAPLAAGLALLARVLGRSFPLLLSAGTCFKIAFDVSLMFEPVWPTVGPLLVFGVLGGALTYFAQALPKSGTAAQAVEKSRTSLARLCGVRPPAPGAEAASGRATCSPFFLDAAAGAPPARPLSA